MPSVLTATSLPDNDPLLDDLQCNTLAPHRRNLSVHLFFRLGNDPVKNREYLRTWAKPENSLGAQVRAESVRRVQRAAFVQQARKSEDWLTQVRWMWESFVSPRAAARRQNQDTSKILEAFRKTNAAPRALTRSIMLSSSGLRKLEPWFSGANGSEDKLYPAQDPAWRRGQYYDERNLSIGGVEHFEHWDPELLAARDPQRPQTPQGIDVHILLAEDGAQVDGQAVPAASDCLKQEIVAIKAAIALLGGSFVAERRGYLARLPGQGYQEHFGFRDGISNVHALDSEWAKARKDFAAPDHGTTLGNLLFELPRKGGRMTYGSYCVFRQIQERLDALEIAQLETLIGRKADGTPLGPHVELDGFDFRADPGPTPQCPFHAHIRKANPRKSSARPKREAGFLFARRSMLYGDRGFDHDDAKFLAAPGEVGLLFMAYMGSIETQFSAMQRQWLAEPDFPQPSSPRTADRIVGRPPTDPLTNLTVVRGGEYFFVPPLSWLADPGARYT